MKKKYLVLCCIVLILSLLLVACNGTANGFKYKSAFSLAKFDTKGIIVEKYIGQDKEVVIPNKLNGKEVRSISKFAFSNTNVEVLKFQNRICSGVQRCYVYEAQNLKRLYLPNNNGAYLTAEYEGPIISGCPNLQEIHFPPLFDGFGNFDLQYHPAIEDCRNIRKFYFYNQHSVVWIKKLNTIFESDLPKTFYDDFTIYVPQNMINEYKLHDIWKNFNLVTFNAVWAEP